MKGNILALTGALLGGALGYFVFFLLVRQGFYALILPGAFVGLGAGIFRNRSLIIAIVCGVLALAVGLFTEWRFAPFLKDPSLVYFVSHLHELRPMTLIMVAVGAATGFWIPFRRYQDAAAMGRVDG